MSIQPCVNNKIIAQTLFLGASVSSFNNSMGWGSQPSQITINLVEDETPCSNQFQFANHTKNTLNHYHDCVGDDCYVKLDGTDYNSSIDSLESKMLPGKVYYSINSTTNSSIVSNYWIKSDPGFFGRKTRIKPDGTEDTNSASSYQYDLINTPVYFKMGNFSFCGLVQSWNRNLSAGGKNYSVVLQSMQSLLGSSYLIIDKYAGSIFSRKTDSIYGSPKNYLGNTGVTYTGSISEGNIPNVFNIYGFLESFGLGGFGPSYVNERGMSANKIINALSVLTSTLPLSSSTLDTVVGSQAPRRAFSPFGRIIAKHAQLDAKSIVNGNSLTVSNLYDTVSCPNFGIIPPSSSGYCEFLLDLSELPSLPDDFRVQGPVISIMDFINIVAEQTGQDVYIDTIPITYNSSVQYVIKIKTISRLSQPRPNMIENTIKEFECNQYAITSDSIGKEKNETNARSLIIGGPQQRLYQAKSYRLSYTQSNFIYNDRDGTFIDYMQLGKRNNTSRTSTATKQFHHGKIKRPNFLTTRNKRLTGTPYQNILDDEDDIQQSFTYPFETSDTAWSDHSEVGGGDSSRFNGNYLESVIIKQDDSDTSTWGFSSNQRWFPLHLDVICPFFGFVNEEELTLKVGTDGSINDTRNVRPVWFDTWTGQIVIVLRVSELPEISVPLSSFYSDSYSPTCNNNPSPITPTAQAFLDTTGKVKVISVINPGANIYGNVSVTITGNGTGATATAKVSNGKVSSINITNGGSGYTNASVLLTVSQQTTNCLPSGRTQNNVNNEFFLLSESEIRAALAGFDNFLIYSLAKLYKPDLIEMVRKAYRTKIINKLVSKGETPTEAAKIADQKVEWYWSQEATNIASEGGGVPLPSYLAADIPDGGQYIPDDAVHDLQILHKFISDIGKYYGKKYMVSASNVISYKDEDFTGIALPTQVGTAYVFGGAGNIRYNYVPTNDGAWEEYGNFIDDSIVVGSAHWFNLSDDKGKIKPLLGYNANTYFDFQRYTICQQQQSQIDTYRAQERISPHWDFMAYLNLIENRNTQCNNENFIFPLLDTSTLNPGDYVITDVVQTTTPSTSLLPVNSLPTTDTFTKIVGYDAYGYSLGTDKKKLYVNTSVEENFIYLDASNKAYPKILIDAPGLTLNHSSTKNQQDPSRTIIANTSIEDLSVYLRTHNNWDKDWIKHMLSYTKTLSKLDNSADIALLGLYRNTSNQSSLQVEIAPKAAHPFFAGIPIRSNQFTYGPWTNYPYLEYVANPQDIFPNGAIIVQDSSIPPSCSSTPISIDSVSAKKAINNWITPISIDVKEDFVPWNYGGMSALDTVAYKEIETKINYENIVEIAQVEMPGLPLFNLGGNFSFGNVGLGPYTIHTYDRIYYDEKYTSQTTPTLNYNTSSLIVRNYNGESIVSNTLTFKLLNLRVNDNATYGPIITNIQTGMGQQGMSTTYSFRTYTRKLGLFNKEESDRIKRSITENFRRARQLAELKQEMTNIISQQRKTLDDQRMSSAQFGTKDFRSKLYGWSPSKVLIGRSSPYMPEPLRNPSRINEDSVSLQSNPGEIDTLDDTPVSWNLPPANNATQYSRGQDQFNTSKTSSNSARYLSEASRFKTDVGLYERKEVDSELNDQYGMKSAMSLDGLLSPISFYPTLRNSTFAYSKYLTQTCPFCNGTKVRTIDIGSYTDAAFPSYSSNLVYCDKCVYSNEKLDVTLKGKTGSSSSSNIAETLPPYIVTSGSDFETLISFNSSSITDTSTASSSSSVNTKIPINLVSLNPILANKGEFRNSNVQFYSGSYSGVHDDINRSFYDRGQHCIEIVARGSVPPGQYRWKLETSKNMLKRNKLPTAIKSDQDYYNYDTMLRYSMNKLDGTNFDEYTNATEMNQRFFGLRGPLVIHGWGYDTEGYPVPNAADEPYEVDSNNLPKRFKLKITVESLPTEYSKLNPGDSFINAANYSAGTIIHGKPFKTNPYTDSTSSGERDMSTVTCYRIKVEDDINDPGGFSPGNPRDLLDGYKGNIISKTQKWDGKWSSKKKMKEFYLDWGEKPNLWPVGPVDLRWDSSRKVWTTGGSGGVSYKMVYATLEEDLVREDDFIETYPARGFLDDIEYSKDNLPLNYRRLIYIKDRSGFTAPRGVKLLCRYDSDSGFYEPISKPTIITTGRIDTGNQAIIDMTYVQGRQSGQIPQTIITFDNKFGFPITTGKIGLFTYVGGKWILTTIQQN